MVQDRVMKIIERMKGVLSFGGMRGGIKKAADGYAKFQAGYEKFNAGMEQFNKQMDAMNDHYDKIFGTSQLSEAPKQEAPSQNTASPNNDLYENAISLFEMPKSRKTGDEAYTW